MGYLQDLYNKAKKSLNDNEGWFRQGQFTPVTQMTGRPLVQDKPLISPIPRSQQLPSQTPKAWVNPYQAPVIEPPKPTFKTQAAEKLNSRLDQIKRYGSSVKTNVNNALSDDKGFIRGNKFTPLAPANDYVEKTPILHVAKDTAINLGKGVQQFGTGLGNAVNAPIEMKRIEQQQALEQQEFEKGMATVRKLREMGRDADADAFVKKLTSRKSTIPAQLDKLDTLISKGKKDVISGGIKTAEIPLTMYAGLPKAAVNMTIGSLLGGGLSKVTGGTEEENIHAAAEGATDAFNYTGITTLFTNPLIERVLKSDAVIGKTAPQILKILNKNPITRNLVQRAIGGFGNVGEDALLAKLDQEEYGKGDAAQSMLIGSALTGNDKAFEGGRKLIDKYVFGKIADTKAPKTKLQKYFGNQYEKVANSYNRGIDSLLEPKADKKIPMDFVRSTDPNTPNKFLRVGLPETPPVKSNVEFKQDPENPSRFIRVDKERKEQMMGGLAGFEMYQDENGEWQSRFNPEKALLGLTVAGGIKSEAGQNALKNLKLPEFNAKAPDVKVDAPKTEIDWMKENNKKPETTKSISDIFANRKAPVEVGSGYTVKGSPIKFEKMMAEGWKPDQIDYAVKLANEAKVTPENAEAYVRGILKMQYPTQAAKMGGGKNIPLPPEPDAGELARIDAKFAPQPEVKPKTEFEKVIDKVVIDEKPEMRNIADFLTKPEPKVETPKVEAKPEFTGSELARQNALKKAELEAGDVARKKISDLLKKEGLDDSVKTVEAILAGNTKASPELKNLIETQSKELGQETVKWKGLPEDKLKENYVPNVKSEYVTDVDTKSDGFISMMNRNTFDPTQKRKNLILPEDMATAPEGFRQGQIAILNEKYYDAEQTNKLIKDNNIPKEKEDEVLEFVKKQREAADKVMKEHIEKTDFGKSRDYLTEAHDYMKQVDSFAGKETKLPVVKRTQENAVINAIDTLQSEIRGDALFFKDKTNADINQAFVDFKLSQAGDSPMGYRTSLNNFINKLTSYDYEDPAVKQRINLYIDSKLKENKVLEKQADKVLRGATEVFSMAQIGGNIKTAITQPTETFRLIPEHGVGSFIKGIQGSFNPKESKRLADTYLTGKEISGNLAQNPIYKEVQAEPAFKDKAYDSFKKFIFKGLEVTENWKNIAYLSALEDAGIKKGLEGQELKRFVMGEQLRLAHMADTDMTPKLMKNNAKAGALLQYSQYLLKNEVLKWDTMIAKDKTVGEKMKKIAGLFLADLGAIGAVAGVTGVAVNGTKGWLSNSGLPGGFGPVITVPWQMASEAIEYSKLSPEEREKQTSLMDREKAVLFRNFVPLGNQLTKTSDVYNPIKGDGVLQTGYATSKKGNVNYVAGDMNPIQKAQALMFGTGAIPNKKEANERWKNLEKDGIYPTLNATQSKILKGLPKEDQQAYYDQQMNKQVTNKQKIDNATGKGEKPGFIESIFGGGKDKAPTTSIADILTSPDYSQSEKANAKSEIKAFIDAGYGSDPEMVKDEDLKEYFYGEVNKMPESTESEKQAKNIEQFKKLGSIFDSETLDQPTKDRLIEMSGIPKEEVEYYTLAKDDKTVKAMRQEEMLSTMKRTDWLDQLEEGRRLVGNKQIVDNATIDELYERGALSDSERDYLKAIKFDPATNEYYLDRDFKKGQANAASAAAKKKLTAYNSLKDKLDSINNRDSSAVLKKSIASYLGAEPTAKKSINQIYGSKIGIKKVTPKTIKSDKVNRVTSKYRFK